MHPPSGPSDTVGFASSGLPAADTPRNGQREVRATSGLAPDVSHGNLCSFGDMSQLSMLIEINQYGCYLGVCVKDILFALRGNPPT